MRHQKSTNALTTALRGTCVTLPLHTRPSSLALAGKNTYGVFSMSEIKKWQSYEEVATYLLDQFAHEFGLRKVEGKQLIKGKRSKASYEIDAKGVRDNDSIFIICTR